MSNRYFKRACVTVHRYYSIYILFIIIQHVYTGISCDKIRLPVHNAMYKEILWPLTKSIKHIKIINKMELSYCYNNFRSSFGYGIFKGKVRLLYEAEILPSFRRHKRGVRCCRTGCNLSWNLLSIRSMSVK